MEIADIEKLMAEPGLSDGLRKQVSAGPRGAARVEQKSQGKRPAAELIASFDGLGSGFEGPQGTASLRNPSDNSLAVGPNHIFQIVNTRMAIYTKKGDVVYGPVPTNTIFKGFGGACESTNNGDAVVRYDQLADRWLVLMPVFRRGPVRPDQPQAPGGALVTAVQPAGVKKVTYLSLRGCQ